MRKILLTTALVLPLGTGLVFAQDTSTTTTGTAAPDATTPATAPAGDAAATSDTATTGADTATTTTGSDATMSTTGADATSTSTDAAPDVTTPDADVNPATATATTSGTDTTTTTDTATTTETTTTDATTTTTDTATTAAASDAVVQQQAENELRVDWIIDASVTSPSGEKIGDVNDLILDGDTGAMKAAVVGVGGFLGIGEKQIAIDWSRLTVNFDANQITTDMTREEAEAAPAYQFREQQNAPADAPAAGTTTTTTTDTGAATTTMPADTAAEPAGGDATGTAVNPTDPANGAADDAAPASN